jgi:hypothetical protein
MPEQRSDGQEGGAWMITRQEVVRKTDEKNRLSRLMADPQAWAKRGIQERLGEVTIPQAAGRDALI